MIVLGIDPGLSFSGFGVMKRDAGRVSLLDYGFLKLPSATDPMHSRIGCFYNFFSEKISLYGVTHLAFETPFLGKNAANFLKLGYLRGIMYLLAHQYSLEILEFSPREIKQALTGFGGAEKDQVARVVVRLFPGLCMPSRYDVTDALAVATCAVWKGTCKTFF